MRKNQDERRNCLQRSIEERNELILKNLDLCEIVVTRYLKGRPNTDANAKDLLQDSVVGLIDAADKYQKNKGSFRPFAYLRIRGAIIDGLRKLDWAPRSMRRKQREINKAQDVLEAKLGRPAYEYEIAAAMGMSTEEFQKLSFLIYYGTIVYIEDMLTGEDNEDGDKQLNFIELSYIDTRDPFFCVEEKQRYALLRAVIKTYLPEYKRETLRRYYEEDMSQKAIGILDNVGESAISQRIKQSHKIIRDACEELELVLL